jgi:hypothetical protein
MTRIDVKREEAISATAVASCWGMVRMLCVAAVAALAGCDVHSLAETGISYAHGRVRLQIERARLDLQQHQLEARERDVERIRQETPSKHGPGDFPTRADQPKWFTTTAPGELPPSALERAAPPPR